MGSENEVFSHHCLSCDFQIDDSSLPRRSSPLPYNWKNVYFFTPWHCTLVTVTDPTYWPSHSIPTLHSARPTPKICVVGLEMGILQIKLGTSDIKRDNLQFAIFLWFSFVFLLFCICFPFVFHLFSRRPGYFRFLKMDVYIFMFVFLSIFDF